MFMDTEQAFELFENGADRIVRNGPASSGGPDRNAMRRISAALGELREARIHPMSREEANRVTGMLGEMQSMVASLMCDVARRVVEADPDTDPGEVLRHGARLSGRESKRMAKIAKQLSDMPEVKERFATGEITPGHANALANAAEKVGAGVVNSDKTLLEAAGGMLPDSFDRYARRWSERKLIEQGLDPLERQRRAREAKMWVEKDTGLGILMAKLPRPQFEQVRQAIDNHYKHHLRQDSAGGHDPDIMRTPKQRLADVVFELATNRDAITGESIGENFGIKAKASIQLILTASLGVVDGTDTDGPVEIIGVGPVPRQILQTLSPDTELAGMIFDRAGRRLWLGRNQRLANIPQRLSVAVRDGGCFECGAPMHRCELHHMQEWHRDGGPTDIDNLVAVCRRHHKWLETQNLAVRRTSTGYQTHPRARRRASPLPARPFEPG
jgi:GH24 family phage-related lysozyme (muramidase)